MQGGKVIMPTETILKLVPADQIENIICVLMVLNEIEKMKQFGEQMIRFCVEKGGAGLSAPQVGINKKMFVWECLEDTFQIAMNAMFYPSGKKTNTIEGCLSYPGQHYYVERYKEIQAVFYTFTVDKSGSKKFVKNNKRLRGERAILFQHEVQHCGNGNDKPSITVAMIGKLLEEEGEDSQI